MPGAHEDLRLVPLPTRKEPRCDIRMLAQGLYALSVLGRLPTGWAGNLSLGLARAGVDIAWGTARKRDGGWEAEFRLRAGAGTDALLFDYARLLRTRSTSEPDAALRLTSYQ